MHLSTTIPSLARSHRVARTSLPRAELRDSASAAALRSLGDRAQSLLDASTTALNTHLESIASFADDCIHCDTRLAEALRHV
ncbi:hypothetical protein [Corynebacterium sp. CCUG 51687]|uniref:hypothetical protein n=1 Tax=Corynebacterium sp. CCUG 51687 TaxID=2823897 RepID=UPI00210B3F9B|nr:hypothetical protein [Corynebacterium sp. CCUG 51687]MCQ4612185.1 hypothetical protein [Corynebacterium sp. CCUG 51687]